MFFAILTLSFLNTVPVFATSLAGASCTVAAEIVDKGTEEHGSKFLKVEILTAKPTGVLGNCSFVSKGDIFKIDGGSSPDPLNVGDVIEAGLEANSAMTPSGVALSFIQWEPVSLISSDEKLIIPKADLPLAVQIGNCLTKHISKFIMNL